MKLCIKALIVFVVLLFTRTSFSQSCSFTVDEMNIFSHSSGINYTDINWSSTACEEPLIFSDVASWIQITEHYPGDLIRVQVSANSGSLRGDLIIITTASGGQSQLFVEQEGQADVNGGYIYISSSGSSTESLNCGENPAIINNGSSASGGDGNIIYQWEYKNESDVYWSTIPNSDSINYDPPSAFPESRSYRRRASSSGQSGYSNVVTFTTPTTYPLHPGAIHYQNGIVCANGNRNPEPIGNSTGAYGGNGVYIYQWLYSDDGTSEWTIVSGATGLSYDPPSGLPNTRWYKRRVTSCTATAETEAVKIPLALTFEGGSISGISSVCYNGPSELSSETLPSGGDENYTYQWELSLNRIDWSIISGADQKDYNPLTSMTESMWYRRIDSSCGLSEETNAVQVVVYPALSSGDIQAIDPICYDGNPDVLINNLSPSGGNGTYSYQWYSSVDSKNWSIVSGAIQLEYDPPANMAQSLWYRREESSCGQTVSSNQVYVKVYPRINAGGIYSTGESSSLDLVCSGGDPAELRSASGGFGGDGQTNYRWEYSDNNGTTWQLISDANKDSYDPPAGLLNNRWYRRASMSCGHIDYTEPVVVSIRANQTWYADFDDDGLGDPNEMLMDCEQPENYVSNDDDECKNIPSPNNECVPLPIDPNPSDQNYIYIRNYQKSSQEMVDDEMIDQNNLNQNEFFRDSESFIQSITYFDGLGRPIQQIEIDQSENQNGNLGDIVTHIGYDGFGRQDLDWLPVPEHIETLGSFRTSDIEASTRTYYKNHEDYGGDFDNLFEKDTNPHSQKLFEPSPLNRILKQAAPGEDWKLNKNGDDHSIKFDYSSNAPNEVRLFQVDFLDDGNGNKDTEQPILTVDNHYSKGELYKTVTKDENHDAADGKLHTTEEFTDKQGRVVLKRTYADIPAMDINGNSLADPGEEAIPQAPHDTYYVYDDFGNLTYVLPPKVNTADGVDAIELKELCYQYIYDHRNRLVQKQLPGKDKEYIVYNKLDQPVLTQDANQRENNEWLFTKYDAFGRVVYTGIYTDAINTDRGPVQVDLDKHYTDNANALLYEKRDNANTANHQYTNTSYPTTNIEVFTVNYYDSYGFSFAASTNPGTVFQKEISAQTKGLATGSKIKVLTTDSWINSVSYYDAKGRPIYSYSENDYLETVDVVETQLDFVGNPVKVKTTHTRGGDSIVTIDNFSYDHVGRLLAQTQCIGDNNIGDSCPEDNSVMDIIVWDNQGDITDDQEASESITVRNTVILPGSNGSTLLRMVSGSVQELIAYNSYDELGQLKAKKVGGSQGPSYDDSSGLQEVAYKYNIRGWLTNINDISDATPDKLFNFKIGYTDGDMPLYNGNISNTQWRTDNLDNTLKTYQYNYDPLNRITNATDNTGNYNLSNVTYDKNGNILTLDRTGHTNTSATTFGNMDDLSYAYEGNKLLKVTDGISGTAGQGGFRDGTNTNDDFEYDDNGSLIVDRNKGITDIEYNHMSLPTKVTINGSGGTGTIDYVYDATGMKQRKIVSTGTTTDYAGNYVYENGDLQMFSHDEGYAMPKDVDDYSQGFEYVYNYVDHLGNVRLSYTDADGNGSIDPANEIVEENNFYPFGLKHKGYNGVVSPLGNSTAKKFKYQGQELNNSLGYDMYEFELRHYDPAIGRFVTTDPYEQFDSPYVAMGNNPVVSFDPDGGYCYDANGNQIACPTDAGDFYDDYNESETSHITILDEVEVDNSGSETQTASISEIESFSPIGRLRGTEKMVAEIEMNIFGSRNVQGVLGQYTVDAQGNILTGPISAGNGAIGLIGGFYNPKNLLKVATILDKGGLTKIGRALQKHASRPGSKFPSVTGNVSNINAQGEKVLNSILTNPSSTTTVRHHGRFGEILEIKAPNGQGARFSKDGNTFIGLIEN